MTSDLWHYPRTVLAQQVLGMFESGLSSALTFFAPRRMGKTEFLCKDVTPLAENRHWKVLYFSFLDVGSQAEKEFFAALQHFADENQSGKARRLLGKVSKISGEAVGIKASVELRAKTPGNANIKKTIAHLAQQGRILLLMDEVQTLAQREANINFIATLRTALDLNKDTVKVIFTGSSQEGLRCMFSQAKAPFFHFGQNLLFPTLDRGFTDHLANLFAKVTKRKLDKATLWSAFLEMQSIPQLARALVERLALNPDIALEQAKQQLLNEVFNDRAFIEIWTQCSDLEHLLLIEISTNTSAALFSHTTRAQLAQTLGIGTLEVPTVQSALRVLQRKGLIGKNPEGGGYFIDDPNFKNWLIQSRQNGGI